jgi:hypothetical protein
MQALVPAILCIALASCGASKDPSNGAAAVENSTLSRISLTSDAFKDGQSIPKEFSCDGASQPPALHWSNPPDGTKSFALVIVDPDAPGGTFRHWGVYDIPASARSIGGGKPEAGAEVINDKGTTGYTGPCPPPGHGLHHYHFKLFALSVDKLQLSGGAKVIDVENAAAKHVVAQGELVGTYERR